MKNLINAFKSFAASLVRVFNALISCFSNKKEKENVGPRSATPSEGQNPINTDKFFEDAVKRKKEQYRNISKTKKLFEDDVANVDLIAIADNQSEIVITKEVGGCPVCIFPFWNSKTKSADKKNPVSEPLNNIAVKEAKLLPIHDVASPRL